MTIELSSALIGAASSCCGRHPITQAFHALERRDGENETPKTLALERVAS